MMYELMKKHVLERYPHATEFHYTANSYGQELEFMPCPNSYQYYVCVIIYGKPRILKEF